jgi:hypothetical protein
MQRLTRRRLVERALTVSAGLYGLAAIGAATPALALYGDCTPGGDFSYGCVTGGGPINCFQSNATVHLNSGHWAGHTCVSPKDCNCADPIYVQAFVTVCDSGGCTGSCYQLQ